MQIDSICQSEINMRVRMRARFTRALAARCTDFEAYVANKRSAQPKVHNRCPSSKQPLG